MLCEEEKFMKAKFVYVGIRVKDLQRSIDFYTKLLGMNLISRDKLEQTKGEIVNLTSENDGFTLELNYYERESPYYTNYRAGEGLDHLAFKVENLDQALDEARAAGYPTTLEIKSGNSRWAYIEDPNGIWIELL
jgi:lactoylglutathione lyase